MGQYHLTVNLDKREFLDPHKLGDGLKLWEQANSAGGVCAALFMLLAVSNGRGGGDFADNPLIGSWGGDRIVVIGDYAERKDLYSHSATRADLLYAACRLSQEEDGTDVSDYLEDGAPDVDKTWLRKNRFTDISDAMVPLLEAECGVKFTTTDGWRRKERADAVTALKPDMIFGR